MKKNEKNEKKPEKKNLFNIFIDLFKPKKIKEEKINVIDKNIAIFLTKEIRRYNSQKKIQEFKKNRKFNYSSSIREVYFTEISFCEKLKNCVDYYIKNFKIFLQKESIKPFPCVNYLQFKMIFSNIEAIYNFHEKFLKNVEKKIIDYNVYFKKEKLLLTKKNYKNDENYKKYLIENKNFFKNNFSLSDEFFNFLNEKNFFNIYSEYVCFYEDSINFLELINDYENENDETKKKKFKIISNFLKDLEKNSNVKYELISILIWPLSRIARYRLLVKDLIEKIKDKEERKKLESLEEKIGILLGNFDLQIKKHQEKPYLRTKFYFPFDFFEENTNIEFKEFDINYIDMFK
jgi:hypothetical protein